MYCVTKIRVYGKVDSRCLCCGTFKPVYYPRIAYRVTCGLKNGLSFYLPELYEEQCNAQAAVDKLNIE